jgi:O-antigen ligase
MYNPGIGGSEYAARNSLRNRIFMSVRERARPANLVGLAAALCALFCLIALPEPWNIRLPLYLTLTIWTLLRPRVALYLLPIAVPWGALDAINLGGANLNSADILVFLLAASWLMSFALRPLVAREHAQSGPLDHDGFNVPRYLVFALLLLLVAMLLSMTVTTSLTSSLKEITKWLEFLIVLLLGAQYIRTRRQIWTLVVIICLAAISQAFMGYLQNFLDLGPANFVRNAGLRVYGTFGQPNPYAGYINMTLTVAIALTLLGRSWKVHILAGFTTLLLAVAVYLSQSRGGEIALTVAVLFIVTLGIPRIRPLMRVGAIGALGVLGAYFAGIVPERYLIPIMKILGLISISFASPSPDDYSTAERLAHWIAGARMFLSHPFLGVGIGNYADAYPRYLITIFANPLGHAHNYYINIAAETGIIGLTAFLLFLIATFIAGGRSFRAVSSKYMQLKAQRAKPQSATSTTEADQTLARLRILTNDRALAVGILASLLSVCVHNMVDNLYVHSMTSLFALLLVILIRLSGVTSDTGSNGGRFDHR